VRTISPCTKREQHAGGVLNRLAATQLDVVPVQEERVSAQFVDADLEGHAGAGGRLREDHRPRLAGEDRDA
jgi:hypothetical protein